jgi:hypothetical protein
MSKQVADGIRDKNGFWKHGHTYMVRSNLTFIVVSGRRVTSTIRRIHFPARPLLLCRK